MSASLVGKRVLITGVGLKPLRYTFHDITTGQPSHTPIIIDGEEYKANIGAAAALECAKAGAIVHMVARTGSNLNKITGWIKNLVPEAHIEYSAIDLGRADDVKKMVESLQTDLPIYWIQSVGLGAGTVQIKDDNPYLRIEEISQELIDAEMTVLKNTISLLQSLLPLFRHQSETRVCIISSMSAVRSVISGSVHMAAKGAISRFTNAAMIELDEERIFVTDVRPGGVDTGLYDSSTVQETVTMMVKNYGRDWTPRNGGPRLMPPTAVGQAIVTALTSEGHITSINLVARGQFPHEGS